MFLELELVKLFILLLAIFQLSLLLEVELAFILNFDPVKLFLLKPTFLVFEAELNFLQVELAFFLKLEVELLLHQAWKAVLTDVVLAVLTKVEVELVFLI